MNAQAATTPVPLGTAAPFSVLGGTTVTNTMDPGNTNLWGDLGVSPGTAITGFPPGIVAGTIHANDAVAIGAQSDLTIAYNNARLRPSTGTILDGLLGGKTFFDGVYTATSSADLTGTVILDAQNNPDATFIFQIGSSLTTAPYSHVLLKNGADACNVYWQVTSSATLGTISTFAGSILALTSITVEDGAVVEGRALARNGAVTLDDNTFLNPCSGRSTSTVTGTTTATATVTGTTTETTTETAPAVTSTVTDTTTVTAPAVTSTVTDTSTVTAPAVTQTVTETVGTATVTETLPGSATSTVTDTATVTAPAVTSTVTDTSTVTAPAVTQTVTQTLPGSTVTATVGTATVTETLPQSTSTVTDTTTVTAPAVTKTVTDTTTETATETAAPVTQTVTATVGTATVTETLGTGTVTETLPASTSTVTDTTTVTAPAVTQTVTETDTVTTTAGTETVTLPATTETQTATVTETSAVVTLPATTVTETESNSGGAATVTETKTVPVSAGESGTGPGGGESAHGPFTINSGGGAAGNLSGALLAGLAGLLSLLAGLIVFLRRRQHS